MRVLLVEDDAMLAEFVGRGLREAGFAVDHESDGEGGLQAALTTPYDVAILDVMLPKRDGLAIIDEMRRRKILTPVLILSARRSVDDRVRGLQAGGDDYLTKPFAFTELLARVQALRPAVDADARPTTLSVDDLEVDLLSRRVRRPDARSSCARASSRLLEYLMRNAGRVVSKTMILSHVWGYQLRSADQRGGRAREPAARPHRPSVRPEAAAHGARRRICPPRVTPSLFASHSGTPSVRPRRHVHRLSYLLPDLCVAGDARPSDPPQQGG